MPKQVDHERRRHTIAESVWSVVAREGIDAVTLQAVAQECGWSVGSIRHYFPTKSDLLRFADNLITERIVERIGGVSETDDPAEYLVRALRELLPLDALRRAEAAAWLAFGSRSIADPALAPQVDRTWVSLHDFIVDVLGRARSENRLKQGIDPDLEALALHALTEGLVLHALTASERMTPETALGVLERHVMRMVRTP